MEYENQYDELTKSSVGYSLSGGLRVNFAKKVFSIVGIQLSLTTLICYSAMNYSNIQTMCEYAFIPAIIVALISSCWLYLSKEAAKQFPTNMILLTLFTISEAISLSVICLGVGDPDLVLSAFLITSAVVISLAAYAMTAKNDFTMQGGALFLLFCGSLVSGIVYLIMRNQAAHLLYLFIGVVIFGFYLVYYISMQIYDIQLICGDKTLALSVDDYVLGSILIYTDVIRLFIRILKFLQEQKKKD